MFVHGVHANYGSITDSESDEDEDPEDKLLVNRLMYILHTYTQPQSPGAFQICSCVKLCII